MKKLFIHSKTIFILLILLTFVYGCKNKDATVLKVYVRSEGTNSLLDDTQVVIIGDVNSNPPTKSYVDTSYTTKDGYAFFDMQPYFDYAGEKENPTGYFDIIYKKDSKSGTGRVRCRVHLTTVETVYLK